MATAVRTGQRPEEARISYRISSAVSDSGGPLAVAEAGAVLGAAPLLIFPNPYSSLALVLLPALWLVRLLTRSRALRRSPADWPLVGLLVMLSVSLYPSVDLALSRPKLYGLILGIYLFTVLIEHLRTPRWRQALATMLVLGSLGVAFVGLVATNWSLVKLPLLNQLYARLPRSVTTVPTSFGPLEGGINPNEVGGTVALLLPFALGLALFSRHWLARLAPGVAAAAMFGTLALTASRSALAGVAVAGLVLAVLRWPRLALLLPVLILGSAGAVWWLGPDRIGEWLLAIETGAGTIAKGRLAIWNRASYMIQDALFTGIGLNTFPVLVDLLYPTFRYGPHAGVPHAHNLFLQVTLDLGVLGMLSFVGLLTAVAVRLVRAWRRSLGWERGMVAGLASGLLAHLIFGLTDAVTLGAKPGVFLWAMLGGAMALGPSAGAASRSGEGNPATGPSRTSEVWNVGSGCDIEAETGAPEEKGAGRRGERPPAHRPCGAGALQWSHWALFTLACGLAIFIGTSGIKMFP